MPLQALQDATRELKGARADVQKLAKRYKIARAIAAGMALVVLLVGFDAWQTHTTLGCVTDWANATTHRTQKLDKPTRDRDAALDKLLVDLGQHAGTATVTAAVQAASAASKRRLAAVAANPPPPPPLSNCGLW